SSYSYFYSSSYSSIYNITINDNTITNGISLSSDSYIYNISISDNTVTNSPQNGISLSSDSYTHDVTITGNTVTDSIQNGISLSSDSYIYDATITDNKISNNKGTGILCSGDTYQYIDVTISSNAIHTNSQGTVIQGLKANITRNAIAYHNNEGILFYNAQYNLANYNDIYGNGWGMNVTGQATVNAENGYWGDPNGPYHDSVNPNGPGNGVNGNGVDLDFVPWANSLVSGVNIVLETAASAPQDLHATAGAGPITLTWNTPTSDGGSPITNYKIYRGITSGGEIYLTTIDNITTYTDTNVTNDQTYYYQVSAVNEIGEGLRSNEAYATPNVTLTQPIDISTIVCPMDGTNNVSYDSNITIIFPVPMNPTSVENAFTLVDNNGSLISGTFVWSTDGKTLTFVPDSPLKKGVTYTLTVTTDAMDTNGNYLTEDYVANFTVEVGSLEMGWWVWALIILGLVWGLIALRISRDDNDLGGTFFGTILTLISIAGIVAVLIGITGEAYFWILSVLFACGAGFFVNLYEGNELGMLFGTPVLIPTAIAGAYLYWGDPILSVAAVLISATIFGLYSIIMGMKKDNLTNSILGILLIIISIACGICVGIGYNVPVYIWLLSYMVIGGVGIIGGIRE
ncbi:MAG: Ig-like domain-containing protein, partial [Thermoplasmata archaeon]|nr:Ig-like domain-containing protein [Thermoplasmata archaeon]